MTNKTLNGVRKHRESTQPNSSKTAKFFRRASSILRQPLTLVYARNSSIFYWAVLTTSKCHKAHVATQTLRLPIWDAIFFICTYAYALKGHLATTRNCYLRSLN